MSLPTSTVRRLALIKYLYRLGVQQSEAPEPLSAVSLFNFHDAIELFLQLASEHLNTGGKETRFMEYWEILSKKLTAGTELPQKESVRRLNDARVGFKHHGTLPSKLDIEAFRTTATSFFEENTLIVFGVSFAEISMTGFVQSEQARENLKDAEALLEENKLTEASNKTAIAFQQVLDDFQSREHVGFFFGDSFAYFDSHRIGLNRSPLYIDSGSSHHHEYERHLGEFIDHAIESFYAIQNGMKILAMGIDYRRYSKFRYLTPSVDRMIDGRYSVKRSNEYEVTADDIRFCIEFVVETAVKLREFDYGK